MEKSGNVLKDNQKMKSYGDIHIYKRLHELLPLKTPLSILIDPINVCNFQCTFCPTGDARLLKSVSRPKGKMSFSLFKKIIDDISEFEGRIKNLHLYKDGEPFLNSDLCRMVEYAREKNISESIETTSNVSLIDKNKAIEIIESGLNVIRLSIVHINNCGYKKMTKTFSNYNKVKENVEFLYNEKIKRKSKLIIHTKIVDIGLSDSEKNKFFNDFASISDTINIDSLIGWSNSDMKDFTLGMRNKITTGIDGKSKLKKNRKICPQPFKTMAVNFNGTVSVCCVDWRMQTVVGDIKREKLIDIWNGKRLRNFRLLHLDCQRDKIEPCRKCQYIYGMHEMADLDEYAKGLMEVYND